MDAIRGDLDLVRESENFSRRNPLLQENGLQVANAQNYRNVKCGDVWFFLEIRLEKRRKSGGAVAGSSWLSGSRHQRSPGHGLSPSKSKTAVPGNTPSASNSPE